VLRLELTPEVIGIHAVEPDYLVILMA